MRILSAMVLLIQLGLSQRVFAAEALDFTIHQHYISTRAMGMGNAFTAIADDHSALFYNPAGLGFRKDGQLRMFLRASIDEKYLELIEDIEGATEGKATEAEELDALQELIEKNYGNHYHSRLPTVGGVWVRPRWGIAFIPADLTLDLSIHRQLGPMLNVNAYLDTTIAYGYGRKVKWFNKKYGDLSVGGTLKAIHRIHASKAPIAAELASDSEVFDTSEANEGLTVDLDIGTLYKPGIPSSGIFSFFKYVKPSFAFVVRNVFDYGFPTNFHVVDEDSQEPPSMQRRFDVGSKWDLPNFWVFDPHFAFDIRDMGHDNWTFKKGLHAGAELYWNVFSWWKGSWSVGVNQGYWTAGFGARLAWFQLDLASYGEEVGTSDTSKESRRYVLEMSLDF